jgi:hypothetical protein
MRIRWLREGSGGDKGKLVCPSRIRLQGICKDLCAVLLLCEAR